MCFILIGFLEGCYLRSVWLICISINVYYMYMYVDEIVNVFWFDLFMLKID